MCPGEAPPCPGDISRSSAAFLQEDTVDPRTHVQHRRESSTRTAPARLLSPSSWDKTRLLLYQVSCQFSSSSSSSVSVKNALFSPLEKCEEMLESLHLGATLLTLEPKQLFTEKCAEVVLVCFGAVGEKTTVNRHQTGPVWISQPLQVFSVLRL